MGILRRIAVILAISAPIVVVAQSDNDYEYERSSLHMMMIKHLNQKYEDIIVDVYKQSRFPERFNNHDLGVNVVSFAESEGDQSKNILSFCEQVNLGQKMVAKWFNRKRETGSFDMELIKERGFYNASQTKNNLARRSLRGKAMLEDAGEQLIKNTYLVINDIRYTSRAGSLSLLQAFAGAYVGSTKAMNHLYDIGGFRVEITSYLFRLKWNDESAATFYENYYTEDGSADQQKVESFKKDGAQWKMEYVGKTFCKSQETALSGVKDPSKLLTKVCTRAIDKNIAELQHAHPDFRIKAPLVSTEPLRVHVGLKEDITPESRFEVLEREIDDNGHVVYKRVGLIRPKKDLIWDNRYMADSTDKNATLGYTEFEIVSGKDFYPGMLVRETASH